MCYQTYQGCHHQLPLGCPVPSPPLGPENKRKHNQNLILRKHCVLNKNVLSFRYAVLAEYSLTNILMFYFLSLATVRSNELLAQLGLKILDLILRD